MYFHIVYQYYFDLFYLEYSYILILLNFVLIFHSTHYFFDNNHKYNTITFLYYLVLLICLNDGEFPSVRKDEGFLNDADRETLKQNGIELAKGTIDKLYEDSFNIYKAFTTAEEKLYLLYSSSDMQGKALRPSMLINKIP